MVHFSGDHIKSTSLNYGALHDLTAPRLNFKSSLRSVEYYDAYSSVVFPRLLSTRLRSLDDLHREFAKLHLHEPVSRSGSLGWVNHNIARDAAEFLGASPAFDRLMVALTGLDLSVSSTNGQVILGADDAQCLTELVARAIHGGELGEAAGVFRDMEAVVGGLGQIVSPRVGEALKQLFPRGLSTIDGVQKAAELSLGVLGVLIAAISRAGKEYRVTPESFTPFNVLISGVLRSVMLEALRDGAPANFDHSFFRHTIAGYAGVRVRPDRFPGEMREVVDEFRATVALACLLSEITEFIRPRALEESALGMLEAFHAKGVSSTPYHGTLPDGAVVLYVRVSPEFFIFGGFSGPDGSISVGVIDKASMPIRGALVEIRHSQENPLSIGINPAVAFSRSPSGAWCAQSPMLTMMPIPDGRLHASQIQLLDNLANYFGAELERLWAAAPGAFQAQPKLGPLSFVITNEGWGYLSPAEDPTQREKLAKLVTWAEPASAPPVPDGERGQEASEGLRLRVDSAVTKRPSLAQLLHGKKVSFRELCSVLEHFGVVQSDAGKGSHMQLKRDSCRPWTVSHRIRSLTGGLYHTYLRALLQQFSIAEEDFARRAAAILRW